MTDEIPGTDGADGSPGDRGAEDGGRIDRRTLLKVGGLAALGAVGAGGLVGYRALSGNPAPGDWAEGQVDRELVERYAPRLEFGVHERWFPTDPRRYLDGESGDGEGATLDGFAALDGYTREFREAGEPPAPTVFYRTLSEESSPLVAVQYWMYTAFDQFAVNFHWHDWELLQVFVDTDADEVVLLSASAHSRKVPNNEHVEPEGGIGLLSEVGAHASALDVDGSRTFRRVPGDGLAADVTNGAVRIVERIANLPFAYGLPRDEGGRIPYSVPELDGAPLWEHPDLPNVRQEDLIDAPLAVREESELATAPTEVPAREPGKVFVLAGAPEADEADHTYELAPMSAVKSALSDFAGPQLSFEFAVPRAVEDAFAGHLTSVGIPWEGRRYDDPLADVSDDRHREAVADEYDLSAAIGGAGGAPAEAAALGGVPSPGRIQGGSGDDGTKVVAAVEGTETGTEGRLRGAPDEAKRELAPEVGFTLTDPPVEAGCLLETGDGETVSTVTAGGAVRLDDVADGDHRLVVDGAGQAPHAEQLGVEGASDRAAVRAGVDGNVTLVPRRDAVKVAVGGGGDGDDDGDSGGSGAGQGAAVDRVAITEDYAGRVYDAPTPGEGDAVYVHRAGRYTVDVVDEEGDPGADRVDPGDDDRIDLPGETGKATVAEYLARYLRESADLTREYREDDGTDDGDTDDDDATTTTTRAGEGTPGGGNDGGGGTTGSTPGGGGGTTRSVAQFFEAAAEAADRAAAAARDGNLQSADAQLGSVRERLTGLRSRVEAQRGQTLSETLATVLEERAAGADRRAQAAIESSK